MRIKSVQIDDEVADILRRGAWHEAGTFHLPAEQLAPVLYKRVDKVLGAIGGKWDRKARGHRFAADARQALDNALSEGSIVDQKKTLEQFFTPRDLALRMAKAIEIRPGDYVLEPSAGGGALIEAALAMGADRIAAIEIDQELADKFTASRRVTVAMRADFLSVPILSITPDKVIMNPPFSGNQDIAHVRHAFEMLRPGGKLAAIMSPHFTFAEDKPSKAFREFIDFPKLNERMATPYFCGGNGDVEECTVHALPPGTFGESGTAVGTVLVLIEKAR